MPPSSRSTDPGRRRPRRIRNRIAQRVRDDAGSASLEFITVGLVLLLPLVYLVLAMATIQGAALAVEAAARQAVRVYVVSSSEAVAAQRAERAIAFALTDAGIERTPTVAVDCRPRPGECLTRLGVVTITVGVSVPLPLVPSVLDLDVPLSVPMQASATQQVSRFGGAR
ncbi:MAG TPA: hypothetical protein PK781_07965 [Terrimesophilobacter sp.]|nr:hypothetical protein [Terrimesophilobacter sp.]